jgi:hypothetical protein
MLAATEADPLDHDYVINGGLHPACPKAIPMASSLPSAGSQKRTDQSALLLMLDYVEAECRALGAEEAARHVAHALSLLNRPARPDGLDMPDLPYGRA